MAITSNYTAYIIEQKIKGRIYLYKVESYWDKAKKQPRQRRTYIGPKQNGNIAKTRQNQSSLVSKGFGDVFLLRYLSDKLGLKEILNDITSISSYSTNIDFVEWGYNRNSECVGNE